MTSKNTARSEVNKNAGSPIVNKTIQNMIAFSICPTHNNFEITNICLSSGCLEPLCPECAKVHLRYHYERRSKCELETILGARSNEYEKILRELSSLKEVRDELASFRNQKHLKILENCLQTIERAKEKLHSIIASYFSTLEHGIKQSLEVYLSRQNEGDERILHESLNKNIAKIEKLVKKIESPEYLRPLLKVMSRDNYTSWEQLREKVGESLEHYKNDIAEVIIDESRLFSINVELGKYVYVQIPENNGLSFIKNSKAVRTKQTTRNIQDIVDKKDFDELMSMPDRPKEYKLNDNGDLKEWQGWEEFAEDNSVMEKLLTLDINRNELKLNEKMTTGGTQRSTILREESQQYVNPDKLRQNYNYFNPGSIQNKFDNSQRSKILLKK